MIVLTKAGLSDAALLATLGRQAFFEAFGEYNDPQDMKAYLDKAFDAAVIESQLSDPAMSYVIALYDGIPAGYLKVRRHSVPPDSSYSNCIQLERIYALQQFIGKKVGRALMQHCIDMARNEKFKFVWLGVWQQNERAISFYKQWGFTIIGTKQFIIGNEVNDDFVMLLQLN